MTNNIRYKYNSNIYNYRIIHFQHDLTTYCLTHYRIAKLVMFNSYKSRIV